MNKFILETLFNRGMNNSLRLIFKLKNKEYIITLDVFFQNVKD